MHATGCACSVCWARNYCDALQLMPYTEEELNRPFIDYYTFHDCTADFRREQRTSAAVERASG